jgi:hypothetical protein
MSKWTIEEYDSYCSLKQFEINGVEADYEDFGEKDDHDKENAADYCCGNMKFESKRVTDEILNKYKITAEEYCEICTELEDKLSFGCCGLCE